MPEVKVTDRRSLSLCAAIVLIQFLATAFLKIHSGLTQFPFDPTGKSAYYWTESALQYRYARMVASGEGIPQVDVRVQAPEGIVTSKELTTAMERVTGSSYRVFNWLYPLPFPTFLVYFYALFSSLPVLIFFWAGIEVSGSPVIAVCLALAYAATPASWDRLLGDFEYEGFALPWLYASFAFCLMALRAVDRKKCWLWSGLVGATLSVGLVSWHFSRFYLLLFVVAVGIYYFLEFDDRRVSERIPILLAGALACCFAVGAFFLVLRANGFLSSPPMLLLYSTVLIAAIRSQFNLGRLPLIIGCGTLFGVLCLGGLLMAPAESGAYGHVYGLFAAKLWHLLQKPTDPSVIPMTARQLWIEAFNSPRPGRVVYVLLPMVWPLFLIGSLRPRRQKNQTGIVSAEVVSAGTLLFLMAAASLFLFFLVERLGTLCVFFIGLYVAETMGRNSKLRSGMNGIAFAAGLSPLAIQGLGFLGWAPLVKLVDRYCVAPEPVPAIDHHHLDETLEWLQDHTQPNDRILADLGVSPDILTYADRPIVLQPKFEAAATRAKAAEFVNALYGSEDDLFRFCEKNGVRYLVYQPVWILDDSPDGNRYLADSLTLKQNSAAFLLHFLPEKLSHFELVFHDMDFRVFHIIKGPSARKRSYEEPVYELNEYFVDGVAHDLHFGDTHAIIRKLFVRNDAWRRADYLTRSGNYQAALLEYGRVLGVMPKDAETWLKAGEVELSKGNPAAAFVGIKRAFDLDPDLFHAAELLSVFYINQGRIDSAIPILLRMHDLKPNSAEICNNLGAAYLRLRDIPRSERYLSEAHRLAPSNEEITKSFNLVFGLVRSTVRRAH